MPQLSGPEQKALVGLVVEHLTEPGQLDRALLHAELGNLSTFTEKGTLPAMTSDLVRALASQYRIVEFVAGVLQGDYLKGQCPPIEEWLKTNREELLRRKNHQNSFPIPPITDPSQVIGWWVVAFAQMKAVRNAIDVFGQSQVIRWWLLAPVIGIVLAGAYWVLPPSVRTPIGPLAGQSFSLQQSLSALTTLNNSRPTRGTEELHAAVFALADDGDYGVVFLSKPIELDIENPSIEVRATDVDGNSLQDRDGIMEIHCLPPDRDRESRGRWSPKLHLKDGVAVDKYDGLLPAGATITVVYHRKEPREAPPTLNVWLK